MVRRLQVPAILLSFLLTAGPAFAQQLKLAVTVFDERTGEPVDGLERENFEVKDGKIDLRVVSAEYKEETVDILVLLDASIIGQPIRPIADPLIELLGEKDQMAVVAYDQSATMLQDFTSSKDLLRRSLDGIEYRNNPRILDALFAGIDGGYSGTAGRRVVLVLSGGAEGGSRTGLAETLQLARRRGVAIFAVYAQGYDSSLFKKLTVNAGGAYFDARRLKLQPRELAQRVHSVIRGYYELDVSGVSQLGAQIEVELSGLPKSKAKPVASALALE